MVCMKKDKNNDFLREQWKQFRGQKISILSHYVNMKEAGIIKQQILPRQCPKFKHYYHYIVLTFNHVPIGDYYDAM